MSKRDIQAKVAADTINISKTGKYTLNNTEYTISTDSKTVFKNPLNSKPPKNINVSGKKATVKVLNESVVKTVLDLERASSDKDKTGLMVFASAYHAGGGFINGAMAQEEAIAYSSNLYTQQISVEGAQYYKANQLSASKAYTSSMLVSNIVFFKDSEFRLIPPTKDIVAVTAAAVNFGAMRNRHENTSNYKKVMLNRMRDTLNHFKDAKCTQLILGAFGCGVFQCDVVDIASNWYELLYDEGFIYMFESITFSVLDFRSNNFSTFDKLFK